MPIVIDPNFTPPPPPESIESADLRLRAVVDPTNTGCLLRANFAEQVLRTNGFVNPRVGVNTTYWVSTGQAGATVSGTREVAGGPAGVSDTFYRMTVDSVTTGALASTGIIFGNPGADAMVGVPGEEATVSVYTRCSVADRTVHLVVTAHDESGGGQVVVGTGADTLIGGAGWVRLSVTFTVPAGKPRLYARVYAVAGATWQVADTMDATAVLAGPSGDYFDGATVPPDGGGVLDVRWTGAADASTSEAFVPALPQLPERVRFYRGDGVAVRTGDSAVATGGIAIAYDHEAPWGQASSWYAVPVVDGVDQGPTQLAALLMPEDLADLLDVWLKSTVDPSLSVRALVEAPPQPAKGGRAQFSRVPGDPLPASTWDVHDGYAYSLSVLTDTAAERAQLEALLDSGPLLMQTVSAVDLPDLYVLPGNLSWAWTGGSREHGRLWQFEVTQVERPATVGAPLRIPGNSNQELLDTYATCAVLAAQVPTCEALLGVS